MMQKKCGNTNTLFLPDPPLAQFFVSLDRTKQSEKNCANLFSCGGGRVYTEARRLFVETYPMLFAPFNPGALALHGKLLQL